MGKSKIIESLFNEGTKKHSPRKLSTVRGAGPKVYTGISKNRGTPKWMVYSGKLYLKWMIWGENPLFSETSIHTSKNHFEVLPALLWQVLPAAQMAANAMAATAAAGAPQWRPNYLNPKAFHTLQRCGARGFFLG